jgi:hypothetical protein
MAVQFIFPLLKIDNAQSCAPILLSLGNECPNRSGMNPNRFANAQKSQATIL